MDNPEIQTTLDSRYRTGKIKNGQSRDTDNNGFKIQDKDKQTNKHFVVFVQTLVMLLSD